MQLSSFKQVDISTITGIGVDVSRLTLDITVLYTSNKSQHLQISNTPTEILEFLTYLANYAGQIVIEPTNIYHLEIWQQALALKLKVVLVDPLKAHHFSRFMHGKTKNDKLDSFVLASIASSSSFEPSKSKEVQASKIRLLVNTLHSLAKTRQVLKSQFKHIMSLGSLNRSDLDPIAESIKQLNEQMEVIEQKLSCIIQEQYTTDLLQKLETIPGISNRLAIILLAILDQDKTCSQWLSYAGVDPVTVQSGTCLKKKKGISKQGNRYLRNILFQIGFGAGVGRHGFFRGQYDKLKLKGRHHIEATMIVGKKVLRIFYAVLKKDTAFNPELVN